MKREREPYTAPLNQELANACVQYQKMRRPMEWLICALSYTTVEYVACVERTVKKHGRASAAAGGGRA